MAAVEAARMGRVFAQDGKAYRRWRHDVDRRSGQQVGLKGAALEQAVMAFAMANPDLVSYG